MICRCCIKEKDHSLDNFYKRSSGKLDTICKDCVKEKSKKRRRALGTQPIENRKVSKEHKLRLHREASARYRIKNKDNINKKNKEKRSTNSYRKVRKEWEAKNRSKVLESRKAYYEKNKIEYIERANKRSKRLKSSILSELYREEIRSIYKICDRVNKITGATNFHVDHIIPLQGENVCGLHAPWNLQILLKSLNWKKSNKFDGTYDNNGWKNND